MRYRRRRRQYPKAFGTRYYSTRRTPGLYRKSATYVIAGAARRKYGRRKILNVIRSIAERKYLDVAVRRDQSTGLYVTNVGNIFCVTEMGEGTSDRNRIGDKVMGTSLELNYAWFPPADVKVLRDYHFRITVFIWKDDSPPSATEIYNIPFAEGEITNYPGLWPYNHDKKVKRKVLYDKCHNMTIEQVPSGGISPFGTDYFVSTPSANNMVRTVIPLTKIKGGLNVINFQNSTVVGVNKIYIIMTSSADAPIVPDVILPFNHYVYTRYNYIDV